MDTMQKEIASVEQLIDVLGGPTDVGKWLGIKQSAVSNWKLRGEIPPGWHLRLYFAAKDRGFALRKDVFGYDPSPQTRGPASKKKAEHPSQAFVAHR